MSDTQKHTKPNVPNLRFPGFRGEWEKRRIGEDCAVNMCKRIFANQTSEQGDVPFFKIGTIGGPPDAYISKDLFEEYKAKYNYPRKGEVMITCAGTVGKTIVFDGEDAYFQDSNIVWLSNPKQLYINSFLNYVLSKVNWNKLNSTTITRIYNDNLRELVINYPSVKEQEKIVTLLSFLDQRIAIQNKVIERLKSLIRGLNNKLMDNPLWDKVYIGDFMQFYSTNSLSWEQLSYENGRIRNLHYGLIHIGLPTMTDCDGNTLPFIQSQFIPKQFTICKDGDIAFADASEDTEEVGKAVELYNTDSMDVVCGLHTIHGRDIMGITTAGFKGFAFNSKYFHNQLRRLAQGSKVYSITAENIKKCYIHIPKVTDQRKIVGLLLCLQDKIECAERELNIFEMQKRFMLREMLV